MQLRFIGPSEAAQCFCVACDVSLHFRIYSAGDSRDLPYLIVVLVLFKWNDRQDYVKLHVIVFAYVTCLCKMLHTAVE